jgi:hypothetical protein
MFGTIMAICFFLWRYCPVLFILVTLGFWSDNLLALRKLRATYPAKPITIISLFSGFAGLGGRYYRWNDTYEPKKNTCHL